MQLYHHLAYWSFEKSLPLVLNLFLSTGTLAILVGNLHFQNLQPYDLHNVAAQNLIDSIDSFKVYNN